MQSHLSFQKRSSKRCWSRRWWRSSNFSRWRRNNINLIQPTCKRVVSWLFSNLTTAWQVNWTPPLPKSLNDVEGFGAKSVWIRDTDGAPSCDSPHVEGNVRMECLQGLSRLRAKVVCLGSLLIQVWFCRVNEYLDVENGDLSSLAMGLFGCGLFCNAWVLSLTLLQQRFATALLNMTVGPRPSWFASALLGESPLPALHSYMPVPSLACECLAILRQGTSTTANALPEMVADNSSLELCKYSIRMKLVPSTPSTPNELCVVQEARGLNGSSPLCSFYPATSRVIDAWRGCGHLKGVVHNELDSHSSSRQFQQGWRCWCLKRLLWCQSATEQSHHSPIPSRLRVCYNHTAARRKARIKQEADAFFSASRRKGNTATHAPKAARRCNSLVHVASEQPSPLPLFPYPRELIGMQSASSLRARPLSVLNVWTYGPSSPLQYVSRPPPPHNLARFNFSPRPIKTANARFFFVSSDCFSYTLHSFHVLLIWRLVRRGFEDESPPAKALASVFCMRGELCYCSSGWATSVQWWGPCPLAELCRATKEWAQHPSDSTSTGNPGTMIWRQCQMLCTDQDTWGSPASAALTTISATLRRHLLCSANHQWTLESQMPSHCCGDGQCLFGPMQRSKHLDSCRMLLSGHPSSPPSFTAENLDAKRS